MGINSIYGLTPILSRCFFISSKYIFSVHSPSYKRKYFFIGSSDLLTVDRSPKECCSRKEGHPFTGNIVENIGTPP